MSYDYYRAYQPQLQNWGTSQYVFPQAPVVPYTPGQNWGGADYYRAHSRWAELDDEDDFFDRVMRGMRRFTGAGFPTEEAQSWRDRIYSGVVDVRTCAPDVIGAAAAYEALRFWDQNNALRAPVLDDWEREEEAILGLSIAEAKKLWLYSGRLWSDEGREIACEVAVATVRRIFRRNNRERLRFSASSRRRSFSNLTSRYEDDDLDEGYYRPRRGSFSGYGPPPLSPISPVGAYGGGGYASPISPGAISPVGGYPPAYPPLGYPQPGYGGGGYPQTGAFLNPNSVYPPRY